MIEHIWTVVCSQSVIDRDSNNVSLFDVLEQITVTGEKPANEPAAVPLEMEVVTLWGRPDYSVPARGRERLTLLSPTGDTLVSRENEIDLEQHRRTRHRARFRGFPIAGEGRYLFRIALKTPPEDEWRDVAVVPVEVRFQAEQSHEGS